MTDRDEIARLIDPGAFDTPVESEPVFNERGRLVGQRLLRPMAEQLAPLTAAYAIADRILAALPRLGWTKQGTSSDERVCFKADNITDRTTDGKP